MNSFKIYGINCVRCINENIHSIKKLDELIKKNDYVYLISYRKINLDEFNILEKVTPIIKISNGMEDIFKSFKQTTRNEINKTYKINELKFVVDDNNNKDIYKLHVNFEYSQGRIPLLKRDLLQSKIFSAYYNNQLICMMTCIENVNVMRLAQISSLRTTSDNQQLKKMISYSSRRIIYEITKYCEKSNFEIFDLGIVNLNDDNKKGVVNFKLSFTDNITNTYIYRYETKKFLFLKSYIKEKFNRYIH